MKRKLAFLLVCIACVALFLSGAKPKLISEDEAKKAGLALINHVFDVNETKATVTNAVPSRVTACGETDQTAGEQIVNCYAVAVPELQDGQAEYIAYVNAETGVAYAAEQSYTHVPKMTNEQENTWNKAYGSGDANDFDYLSMDIACKDFARDWIAQKFDLKAKVLGMIDGGSIFDQAGGNANFYVVIRDGTIYHITIAWPQLTVVEVTMLNQTQYTGDAP